ncbi:Lon protease family protein [Phaeobacter gallaeciensis]|uniref:Lon protease family protein n=1 Tax=Phaeobacter gallaeciensis TaxID=60890 RepID=UPI00237F1FE7|nr:ATP-binding protein [Phaeobacter gallaeciensis]MDE4097350.1 ATP-binding protein [Phaeobacter gallaeciensis]MDE4106136.1 ATP-binding protein [Phaeobacter gallaeciensis]MDE4110614.1 ATP-binding protein [Phaeobacter gallaeciensis]MDE4115085.1 ATP-binding protein [Phaeobacter gallaeciensis]MDE4119554.1 ATP-binding protein [Phaeobacter gallaeciensis]
MSDTALSPDELRRVCDPTEFEFATTADLEPLEGPLGQGRGMEAIRLSAQMKHRRFNLYVQGPRGSGRKSAVLRVLEEEAASRPIPKDWVYVQNFEDADQPNAICLPRGQGVRLRNAMARLLEELANHIPALLVSEDYQNKRMALEQDYNARREEAFDALRQKAEARNVAILSTPMGFSLAAKRDDEIVKPEVIEKLPEEERIQIRDAVAEIQSELEDFLLDQPELEREQRDALTRLNAEMARIAVDAAVDRACRGFVEIDELGPYFTALRDDLVAHADLFLSLDLGRSKAPFPAGLAALREDPQFHRYHVNVVVTHEGDADRAPVVEESLPTLANLTGQIDYMAMQGVLVTDFTQIKPGALHRANGGFLVLDARRVLAEPLAWDALKRCLETEAVHVITPGERLGLISTTTMKPEPIPLDVRVVLVGDRMLHMLLAEYDPDFDKFFRVTADFGPDMVRDADSIALFARRVAALVNEEALRPVTADGVAALIDAASRASADQEKLSLRIETLWDILREGNHYARQEGAEAISAKHVNGAITAAEERRGLIRDRMREMIAREQILISTRGSEIGQINGLTVSALGEESFGAPVRITARVRVGSGRVVDIEREAKLGGPIHSKAVLILSGYLAARYVPDAPLSLWASLVFEQSYGGVEGDSASLAELCALMSALAEVPISQSFAVTGSVNQMGDVQPIGGVNEKIEGFFEVCRTEGLTGRQGVLIPRSNVENLMLKPEVVEAVRAGQFQIHAVSHVDEAIEQLTGLPAGLRDLHGAFEDGSVNANIEVKLLDFAQTRAAMGGSYEAPNSPDPED